jgi:hypothetical protein
VSAGGSNTRCSCSTLSMVVLASVTADCAVLLLEG